MSGGDFTCDCSSRSTPAAQTSSLMLALFQEMKIMIRRNMKKVSSILVMIILGVFALQSHDELIPEETSKTVWGSVTAVLARAGAQPDGTASRAARGSHRCRRRSPRRGAGRIHGPPGAQSGKSAEYRREHLPPGNRIVLNMPSNITSIPTAPHQVRFTTCSICSDRPVRVPTRP